MSATATASTVVNHRCANHPTRDGVGICMSCRKVICEECSTKLDGINTCIDCLNEKVAKTKKKPSRFLGVLNWLVGAAATLFGLAFLCSTLMAYGVWIPDSDGFGFGNKMFANRNVLEKTTGALVRYRSDVSSFPTQKQSFKALNWRRYFPDQPVPKGYKTTGDYWNESAYAETMETYNGTPLDAYETPILYVNFSKHKFAVVISAGADKVFSTNRDTINADIKEFIKKKMNLFKIEQVIVPRGDDMLRVVH